MLGSSKHLRLTVLDAHSQFYLTWLFLKRLHFFFLLAEANQIEMGALGASDSELYTYLNVDTSTRFYTYCVDYLPSMLQLGLLALIPVIVQASAIHVEGYQSMTEVQEVVTSRYFYFQIANIFVSIGAGSFSTYFTQIIYNPSDIPVYLAEAFPLVAAYFIEFIIIKTCFGLFWELARAWPATQYMVARIFTDRCGVGNCWHGHLITDLFSQGVVPTLTHLFSYPDGSGHGVQ